MEQQPPDLSEPIVINIKKKKKRKYSRGLRDFQVVGRRTSKVSSRVVRSISKGLNTFRKANDKSSRKKRDGGLLDLNRNLAKGLGRSLRESSRIPFDLAKAFETRGSRRRARRQTRALGRFMQVFRWR